MKTVNCQRNILGLNQMGMTAIEMVVGIVLAVGFMTLMVEAYIVTMKLSKSGIQRVEQLEESQLILEQITRDWHSAVNQSSGEQPVFQLVTSTSSTHGQGYFAFNRVSYGKDSTQPVILRVSYPVGQLERMTKDSQNLTLSQETTSANPIDHRNLGLGLKETKYLLMVEFYSPSTTGDKQVTWQTESTPDTVMPDYLKVTLELQNRLDSRVRQKLTRIIRRIGS
jgi:hypothetical protein